jgi:hypothetical protein
MTKRSLEILRLATAATLAGALLGTATPALAQSDGSCSNHTLFGDYAFTIEGLIVTPAGALPLRGVALTHFNGFGKLTQVDHVVVNGMLPAEEWTPGTGTYSINRDCTGEAEIIIPGNPSSPVVLRLVVGSNGTQIFTVVQKAGYVTTSTATKVHPR